MDPRDSIFLDFRLPNATSWFYIALLVSLALFFRFQRIFGLRNWDLLMLFALVPGLLALTESRTTKERAEAERLQESAQFASRQVLEAAGLACSGGDFRVLCTQLTDPGRARLDAAVHAQRVADHDIWRAYLALLIGSGYYLVRCLVDLAIARRPLFIPNLTSPGLAFLGTTLLIVLAVKTMLPPAEPVPDGKATSVILEKATAVAAGAADKMNRDRVDIDPELWLRRSTAIACHVLVVAGLVWIGARHFGSLHAGIGAAVLYLLLPYTARYTQELHHVLPAALMVAAFAAYRRPVVAGLILGLASASVYFPLMLFPVWFGFYRGKGARRFALAFGLVLVSILAYSWLDPTLRPYLQSAMSFPDWRAWDLSAKPVGEGLWTGLELHFAYRVPLFIVYVALVVGTCFWPSPKNLGQLIALSTALILGVQFWYADSGGIYVLWYLPLLILVTVRPNLSSRFAPDPDPGPNALQQLLAWIKHRFQKPSHQLAVERTT